MKLIPLTKGFKAIVDEEDYDRLMKRSWCYSAGYAVGWFEDSVVMMHRYILNYWGNLDIDHINNDGLDNQKENLRIVTRTINNHNRKVKPKNIKRRVLADGSLRFDARVQWYSQSIHLGTYIDEEDAKSAVMSAVMQIMDDKEFIEVYKAFNRWDKPSKCIVSKNGNHIWIE